MTTNPSGTEVPGSANRSVFNTVPSGIAARATWPITSDCWDACTARMSPAAPISTTRRSVAVTTSPGSRSRAATTIEIRVDADENAQAPTTAATMTNAAPQIIHAGRRRCGATNGTTVAGWVRPGLPRTGSNTD